MRAVSSLNQVLFAYNEQYCINEKRAVLLIATFELTHHVETPYRVIINEAVELAKQVAVLPGLRFDGGTVHPPDESFWG